MDLIMMVTISTTCNKNSFKMTIFNTSSIFSSAYFLQKYNCNGTKWHKEAIEITLTWKKMKLNMAQPKRWNQNITNNSNLCWIGSVGLSGVKERFECSWKAMCCDAVLGVDVSSTCLPLIRAKLKKTISTEINISSIKHAVNENVLGSLCKIKFLKAKRQQYKSNIKQF